MIIPLGSTRDTQSLVEIDKTETGIAKKPLLPVRFVPLLHGQGEAGGAVVTRRLKPVASFRSDREHH